MSNLNGTVSPQQIPCVHVSEMAGLHADAFSRDYRSGCDGVRLSPPLWHPPVPRLWLAVKHWYNICRELGVHAMA